MENTEVKKLKINATKIRSSLFGYNKKLVKLKKDRIRLSNLIFQKKKISKKESSVESPTSFRQSVANVGKRLISGPMTLIDKFKEFFGFILLGILVNNLPSIIQKLQDVFVKIKTFLDQNPWIVDTIKFGFEKIGESIMALAKFVKAVRPYIGGSFKFALDTIKATKNQIGSLIQTFDELDLSFGGLIKDLGVDKAPDPSSKDYSSFVSGGGKAALEEGKTVQEVVEQGNKNISSYDSGSRISTQKLPEQGYTPYKPQPPQKFARGGTIKPISSGDTYKGETTKISAPTAKTPFARPGGTAKGRKARQAVNSFAVFNKNTAEQSIDVKNQEQNYNLFEDLLKKFKELQALKEVEREGGGDGGGGEGEEGFPGTLTPGQWGPLLDLISSKESGGNYEAMYPSTTLKGATKMTIAEVARRATGAVGKYQQKPEYLVNRAKAAGLDPNKDLYDKKNQDLIAAKVNIGMNRGGNKWLQGKMTDDQFMQRLSMEFAALPNAAGMFYYPRQRSAITPKQVKAALAKVKGGGYSQQELAQSSRSIEYVPPDSKTKITVTSKRGWRWGRMHQGTDIATNSGVPLRAVSDGVIVDFGQLGKEGWGNFLVYKDDRGIYHLYGHMLTGFKTSGKVKRGDIIGRVGSTGRSSGPHLHWETGTGWTGGAIKNHFEPLSRYSANAPFFTPREESSKPSSTPTATQPRIQPAKTKADLMGSVSSLPSPRLSPAPKNKDKLLASTTLNNTETNVIILRERTIIG